MEVDRIGKTSYRTGLWVQSRLVKILQAEVGFKKSVALIWSKLSLHNCIPLEDPVLSQSLTELKQKGLVDLAFCQILTNVPECSALTERQKNT